MDPNRFIQKGGTPEGVSVKTYGLHKWGVYFDGRLIFDGDLYAAVHWVANARRLADRAASPSR